MKMIFLVQKGAWFVERQQSWYRLDDMQQVELGLAGLPMNMVNQHELPEQPHHAGSATIRQLDERTLRIVLTAPDDVEIDSIDWVLDQSTLLTVDWNTKHFRDGWISADVQLTLENVGTMTVDAYLPPREGSEGKLLRISDTRSGSVKEVWLARDSNTRFSVVEEGDKGKISLKFDCEPEAIDLSTDPRQLGFVMVSEEAWPVGFVIQAEEATQEQEEVSELNIAQ